MTELPQREDFGDYAQWPGRAVLDSTGSRLGEVREIYLDDATDRPEWVLVEMGEDSTRYVPLADATVDDDAIRVAHAAGSVEAAPTLTQQKELSQEDERRLYSHYGLRTSEDESESLLPDPEQPALALAATPPAEDEAERPRPEAAAPEPEPEPEPQPEPSAMVENPPPVLPATGETSEPADRGPMVPPRPEPVAPPRLEPEPSGPLAAVRNNAVPIAAGLAASLAALVFIVRRRR